MKKTLFFKLILAVLTLILLISCGKKKEEVKPLVMGLVPVANSEKLTEDIAPFHEMLSKNMGMKVEGFIASNYVGVVEALGTGTVDFALIPPFAYMLANKKHGSEALLSTLDKHGENGYYSVLIVKADSGINDVKDLAGKKFAFVDPSSTSGYIFPAVILKDNGLDIEKDIQAQFSGGHDKSIQLLINGDVDAIGTYERAINKYLKEFPNLDKQLKVLIKSDLIPGVTLTVSPKVDKETKEKIVKAFTEVGNSEEGKAILSDLFGIHGFQTANPESYQVIAEKLEKMGIDIEKIK